MKRRAALLIPVAVACVAATAEGQNVTYTGAVSYSSGSYVFDERSNTFFFTHGVRVGVGEVDLGVSVPILIHDGGLVSSVVDGVPLPTGGSQSPLVAGRGSGEVLGTRRGRRPLPSDSTMVDSVLVFDDGYAVDLGDPYVSLRGEVYSGFGTLRSLALGASAKVPTSSPETGVGSGEWDFGLGTSMVFGLGSVLFLADASYLWLGDMPELELGDGFTYALGASVPAFSARGSFLVSLSGMSGAVTGMDPPVSVSASLGRGLAGTSFVSGGISVGLTESAPDLSVFLGWSVRLLGG